MSTTLHRSRAGFTLIELLVVVVIIGLLVSLTVPAVQAAREAARQAKCTNHQKELGTAVIQYETSRGQYPGYVNQFGSNDAPLSWAVMVLADLGRADLWKMWRSGEALLDQDGDGTPDGFVSVEQLVCPSDFGGENQPARLSYVANCGRADDFGVLPRDRACNGVFQHRYFSANPPSGVEVTPVRRQVTMSASDISDGTQQTLMFSETVVPTEAATAGDPVPLPHCWADDNAESRLGFIWSDAPAESQIINQQIEQDLPRPASRHPAGVIATFCDGHTRFLREDIDYYVYVHLMTPNSRQSGYSFGAGNEALDEDDY